MTLEPPVFEERRRTPDRRQRATPTEDETRLVRTAVAAAVALCGGLVVIYLFFGTVAELSFTDAAAATAVAAAMAAVWAFGYWYRQRNLEPRGPNTFDRERRGF